MIDLHLHTTASDGWCTPAELVSRVRDAGLTTFAVTDHDTMASLPDAAALASRAGLRFVPGIEISTVWQGRDVHVLGYFVEAATGDLERFLDDQRQDRVRRQRAICTRLEEMGMRVDAEALIRSAAAAGQTVGRPQVAVALVDAGYASSLPDAFDRFLGRGCPAYVPRREVSPFDVLALLARCGAVSSLAHPGLIGDDTLIAEMARSGLDALEVYHPEHDADRSRHYEYLARQLGLAVTGGSDFHGDRDDRYSRIGSVPMSREQVRELFDRAARAAARRRCDAESADTRV